MQLMAGLDAEPSYADPNNSPGSYDTPPEMQGAALQESTSAQSVNENDDSGSIDTDTAANLNRVWLTYDPSLNENMAQEYLTDPPDDWTGQPGTINVVSNNQNLIIVWGAGANGKPITIRSCGKYAIGWKIANTKNKIAAAANPNRIFHINFIIYTSSILDFTQMFEF